MALPITVTNYQYYPRGPFVSSSGDVYLIGNGNGNAIYVHKCSDPDTGSFSPVSSGWVPDSAGATFVSQYGDILDIFRYSTTLGTLGVAVVYHRTWNMATDTWGTLTSFDPTGGTPDSTLLLQGGSGAHIVKLVGHRRSDGDIICAYTSAYTTSKGKDYSRCAGRRLPSGSSTWGSATQIGNQAPSSTNAESETIASGLVYDETNDRICAFVHAVDDSSARRIYCRAIEGSDNLDGTTPGTLTTVVTASGLTGNGLPDLGDYNDWDSVKWPVGYGACYDGTNYRVMYSDGTNVRAAKATAAATPSWSTDAVANTGANTFGGDNFHTEAYAQSSRGGQQLWASMADEVVALYSDWSTQTLRYQTWGGSSWSGWTSTGIAGTIYAASVIDRDGYYKVASVYNSSGTIYYNEYNLWASGPLELPNNKKVKNKINRSLSSAISGQLR